MKLQANIDVELLLPLPVITDVCDGVEISGLGEIYYTTNGLDPDFRSTKYEGKFTVDNDCYVKAICYNGCFYSAITTLKVNKSIEYYEVTDEYFRTTSTEGKHLSFPNPLYKSLVEGKKWTLYLDIAQYEVEDPNTESSNTDFYNFTILDCTTKNKNGKPLDGFIIRYERPITYEKNTWCLIPNLIMYKDGKVFRYIWQQKMLGESQYKNAFKLFITSTGYCGLMNYKGEIYYTDSLPTYIITATPDENAVIGVLGKKGSFHLNRLRLEMKVPDKPEEFLNTNPTSAPSFSFADGAYIKGEGVVKYGTDAMDNVYTGDSIYNGTEGTINAQSDYYGNLSPIITREFETAKYHPAWMTQLKYIFTPTTAAEYYWIEDPFYRVAHTDLQGSYNSWCVFFGGYLFTEPSTTEPLIKLTYHNEKNKLEGVEIFGDKIRHYVNGDIAEDITVSIVGDNYVKVIISNFGYIKINNKTYWLNESLDIHRGYYNGALSTNNGFSFGGISNGKILVFDVFVRDLGFWPTYEWSTTISEEPKITYDKATQEITMSSTGVVRYGDEEQGGVILIYPYTGKVYDGPIKITKPSAFSATAFRYTKNQSLAAPIQTLKVYPNVVYDNNSLDVNQEITDAKLSDEFCLIAQVDLSTSFTGSGTFNVLDTSNNKLKVYFDGVTFTVELIDNNANQKYILTNVSEPYDTLDFYILYKDNTATVDIYNYGAIGAQTVNDVSFDNEWLITKDAHINRLLLSDTTSLFDTYLLDNLYYWNRVFDGSIYYIKTPQ